MVVKSTTLTVWQVVHAAVCRVVSSVQIVDGIRLDEDLMKGNGATNICFYKLETSTSSKH